MLVKFQSLRGAGSGIKNHCMRSAPLELIRTLEEKKEVIFFGRCIEPQLREVRHKKISFIDRRRKNCFRVYKFSSF